MLAAILTLVLLAGAHAFPADGDLVKESPPPPAVQRQELPPQPKPAEVAPQPLQPIQPEQPLQPLLPTIPPQENPNEESQPGGPPPGDLAESPDASPVDRSGTSDLDTDSTFWGGYGWGYRRPYYGYGGGYYSSPWRRWGGYGYGGRGYGGGWGWGGRGWGWGGRGWGWGGGYWG